MKRHLSALFCFTILLTSCATTPSNQTIYNTSQNKSISSNSSGNHTVSTPLVAPSQSEPRPTPYAKDKLYSFNRELYEKLGNETNYTIYNFSEGLALVEDYDNETAGYINQNGEWIIPPQSYPIQNGPNNYDLRAFHEGLAAFPSDNGYGYIDPNGQLIIPINSSIIYAGPFKYGLAPVTLKINEDTYEYRYITRTGEIIKEWYAPYVSPECSNDGLHIIIDENERYGFMYSSGKVAIEPQYLNAHSFSEELAAVQFENGLWGYINKSGEIIIEPQFTIALYFKNNFARVSTTANSSSYEYTPFAYINKDGDFLTEEICYPALAYYDSHYPPYDYPDKDPNDFNNGYLVLNTSYATTFDVINTKGETADFSTDLIEKKLQPREKEIVEEYTFNNKSGTLFLFEDRAAKIYDSFGNLVHTGIWVAPLFNFTTDIIIQLDGLDGFITGSIQNNSFSTKDTDSIRTITLHCLNITDENIIAIINE